VSKGKISGFQILQVEIGFRGIMFIYHKNYGTLGIIELLNDMNSSILNSRVKICHLEKYEILVFNF